MKKERLSNFEILRIFCMYLIIVMHWVDMCYGDGNEHYWLQVSVYSLGNLGVSIFALISGYFGIKFNKRKIIELYLCIWIMSVADIVIRIMLKSEYNTAELIQSFFPIVTIKYWFMTAYFILYFFAYFIEKLIATITKKEYQILLLLLMVIFCVIPSVFVINSTIGNDYVWIIIMYFVGAYIRLYDIKINELFMFLVGIAITVVCTFIWTKYYSHDISGVFFRNYSINIFMASISLFVITMKKKIYLKGINIIAKNIFLAYILDANLRILFHRTEITLELSFGYINLIAVIIILTGLMIGFVLKKLLIPVTRIADRKNVGM